LRLGSLIAGGLASLLAVVLLGAGTWALWLDRVDRGDGFVTVGSSELTTKGFAFESPLHGDGPRWLYGSTVWGTGRFRATSRSTHALFMGIARTDDVARYLNGTGYATIQHLATGDVTTHEGGAPTAPPAHALAWAASTQGDGQLTLPWRPRAGDWSIVLMNSDASPGVALHGDLGAEAPLLPWIAGGLLVAGVAFGSVGGWLSVRGLRARRHPRPLITTEPQIGSSPAPVAAPPKEEVKA
jgi:hypothetical protein